MRLILKRSLPCAFLGFILLVCYLTLLPGVSGGFLFDDYPNLNALGALGGVVDWETFHAFVFSGWSGPTGRPLALASFLLDDNTWPSHAPWFKHTNILIHILCGLLLCWANLLLLRNLGSVSEQRAQWIAVCACALWLLHPYMVSTTLYVVQRMAQLAALFSLFGIVLYLYGRLLLPQKKLLSYVVMTAAVGLGTVLATYSKENGALLPLLILCIEFCLLRNQYKPAWQWRAPFLWLPSLVLIVMLVRYIDFSENPWPNRNFNQIERLLTEARIVVEYLYHLLIPRIEGNGLYQDGFRISKGLVDPLSTLLSIILLSGLLGLAFIQRKRAPIFSLALLFFFCAHLMESTVVGLELYFEHRNYLSALFLFLPLAYYAVVFSDRYKFLLVVLVVVLALMTSMAYLRASLWADNEKLELYWAQSATESPRAINSVAAIYMRNHEYQKANAYLEEHSKRLSESSLLTVRLLLQKVHLGIAVEEDFLLAAMRLPNQGFDAQAVNGIRQIVDEVIESDSVEYAEYTINLIDAMSKSSVYNGYHLFVRLRYYMKGQLYRFLNQSEPMLEQYDLAIQSYSETDAALAMVAEVASAGYFEEALNLLGQAEGVLSRQSARSLKRSRESYRSDIEHLYETIINEIQGAEY